MLSGNGEYCQNRDGDVDEFLSYYARLLLDTIPGNRQNNLDRQTLDMTNPRYKT